MKVLIIGDNREGKTTVSRLFHDLLKSLGLNVTLHDVDTKKDHVYDERTSQKLQALTAKGVEVNISTHRVSNVDYKKTELHILRNMLWEQTDLVLDRMDLPKAQGPVRKAITDVLNVIRHQLPRMDPKRDHLLDQLEDRFSDSIHELDGHVHDAFSRTASTLNNDGVRTQLEFLYDELGEEWCKALLKSE